MIGALSWAALRKVLEGRVDVDCLWPELLVLLFLGLAGPSIAMAAPADRAALSASLQKIVDDYLATNATTEGITAVSASVSVAGGKAPVIDVVAGRVGNAVDAAAVTPATLFPIGSITKSMPRRSFCSLSMKACCRWMRR
jgi:hypothetical protein